MGSTFNILFYFTLWNPFLRPTLWMGRLIKQMMHWRLARRLKDENGYQDAYACWLWPGYQILLNILFLKDLLVKLGGNMKNAESQPGNSQFFVPPRGWIKHIQTAVLLLSRFANAPTETEVRTSWRITPPRCGFWWPSPGAKKVGF